MYIICNIYIYIISGNHASKTHDIVSPPSPPGSSRPAQPAYFYFCHPPSLHFPVCSSSAVCWWVELPEGDCGSPIGIFDPFHPRSENA